jgi:biotin-(acetyl-CoA carboxylase) ligase
MDADFIRAWEQNLALRDQLIYVSSSGAELLAGQIAGLNQDGCLLLDLPTGEQVTIQVGEIHLRPVDSSPK